jgi:hypothetical protein
MTQVAKYMIGDLRGRDLTMRYKGRHNTQYNDTQYNATQHNRLDCDTDQIPFG